MLKVEQVKKRYGKKEILHGITLEVEDGKCLGIVGPNGSGKSTLLSIMVGVLKAEEGSVIKEGKIGYVPQNNALMEDLTVKDNLDFWCAAYGRQSKEVFNSVYFKELLGLKEMMKQRVNTLSGGMKKRVNIGIALINDPDYIILDEPCAALDIIYKNEIIEHLNYLKQQGKTIIYTSHSGDELERLCDRLCVLKQGSIILDTTVEVLKKEQKAYQSFDEMLYKVLL